MRVINLFGGPGAGKSTTAASVFVELKCRGLNVELVTEYAKDLTWEARHNVLSDQVYILAKQHRRIARLEGKVDWVVTDAPFILGLVYTPEDYLRNFEPLLMELWNQYENNCFLLERGDIKFHQAGRNQNLEQAKEIDATLRNLLETRGVDFTEIRTGDTAAKDILKKLNID